MNNTQQLQDVLKNYSDNFHTIVPFNAAHDKLLLMNFTATNTQLTQQLISDLHLFDAYIKNKLQQGHYKYGIGGYNEHRTIYSMSKVFDAKDSDAEPRRLHLGIDIWGNYATPVYAPLNGVVHSFAFNKAQGDYGATIILQHTLTNLTFYTLYGHLSLADLTSLHKGKEIPKGSLFAHFGAHEENGFWPPHLHFQIIANMYSYEGDYPGVCRYSEKEKYLQNCVDPDLILNMMRFAK